MLIKEFQNNGITITKDYILMRDCINTSSRDLLIVNINDVIYLEYTNNDLDYKSRGRLGKITKIDIDSDSIDIEWICNNTIYLEERIDTIYVPHIIGGSRTLPVYQPIERLVNVLI